MDFINFYIEMFTQRALELPPHSELQTLIQSLLDFMNFYIERFPQSALELPPHFRASDFHPEPHGFHQLSH